MARTLEEAGFTVQRSGESCRAGKERPVAVHDHAEHPHGLCPAGLDRCGRCERWVTPTGQITTTCLALGTPGHSWHTVAQSDMGIGQKEMLFAGKSMALTALEFMANPARLQAARDEFEQKIGKTSYVCPIPDGVRPF